MKLSDFNYELPDSLIATRPPVIRGNSRLLFLDRKNKTLVDNKYSDISNFLKKGDLLILNNTKVIKARLDAVRSDGTHQEMLVLEKHSFDDDWHNHRVLYRRKLKVGDKFSIGGADIIVEEVLDGGIASIKSSIDLLDIAESVGSVPLPPYMKRKADNSDVERYQTVWAKDSGSVAAPTASLNMTDDIITTLKNNDVRIAFLTLHVGLGTFLPIRTDEIENHHMHKEYFEIPKQTVDAIKNCKECGGRVIALGTTVARTLEYATKDILLDSKDLMGEADIFIYPGYNFKTVDGLLTNFHAPKSTVLMLAAAFVGWDYLSTAYSHAIHEKYSFLSYGDSMLIL